MPLRARVFPKRCAKASGNAPLRASIVPMDIVRHFNFSVFKNNMSDRQTGSQTLKKTLSRLQM